MSSTSKKQATHFGAGNIGRGFIGQVLHKNGYLINFVDNQDELIEKLNRLHSYNIKILGPSPSIIPITNYRGLSSKNAAATIEALLASEVITISIGAKNLGYLVKTFNTFLEQKALKVAKGDKMVQNIICAENGTNISSAFKKMLVVSDALDPYVGFVDAAVDRIVPNQNSSELDLDAESFYEFALNKTQWRGTSKLVGVDYYDNVLPIIERKLYTLNGAHALIAWSGFGKYREIYEYVNFPSIAKSVDAYFAALVSLFVHKYHWESKVMTEYANKIKARLSSPFIHDDIERVGRNVISKLSPNERIIGPLLYAYEHKLPYAPFVEAAGVALKSKAGYKDPEYLQLQEDIKKHGVAEVISKITGITNPKLISEIVTQYKK